MTGEDKTYRRLQQHLDKQAIGFPATMSGADIRFLKYLFTPDEAKVALCLTYKPAPVGQIIEKAAREFPAEQTAQLLESMFEKGAIGWKEIDNVSHWHVMPLVIGMYEAQDGNPTQEFLAAARAYMKTPAFGKSFLAVKPSQMRTIPVNQSVTAEHSIVTYDQIHSIVLASPGPFVVLSCICREAMALKNKPCKKTSRLETCMGFSTMAAMVLRRKHGREISRGEALEILQQNQEDGLVLQPANAQQPEFVCSCCGCCCGMLSVHKLLPHPVDFWTSNFYAEVAANLCQRCSTCISRCQVDAITLTGADGTATINLSRCIGCGLCVPTCPASALQLRKKLSAIPVPKNEQDYLEEVMANKKGAWKKARMIVRVFLGMRH
ncbi:MAG TPA: 4Fe-4S binding protein [Nitrospirota bacterium]|nr:4Fe-4S binding protein [Nitrospirota bacterium]